MNSVQQLLSFIDEHDPLDFGSQYCIDTFEDVEFMFLREDWQQHLGDDDMGALIYDIDIVLEVMDDVKYGYDKMLLQKLISHLKAIDFELTQI